MKRGETNLFIELAVVVEGLVLSLNEQRVLLDFLWSRHCRRWRAEERVVHGERKGRLLHPLPLDTWIEPSDVTWTQTRMTSDYATVKVCHRPLLASSYSHLFIQALHQSLPPFSPIVSVELLPYLAIILLVSTFALAFYFSTYVLFNFGYKPHQ